MALAQVKRLAPRARGQAAQELAEIICGHGENERHQGFAGAYELADKSAVGVGEADVGLLENDGHPPERSGDDGGGHLSFMRSLRGVASLASFRVRRSSSGCPTT